MNQIWITPIPTWKVILIFFLAAYIGFNLGNWIIVNYWVPFMPENNICMYPCINPGR